MLQYKIDADVLRGKQFYGESDILWLQFFFRNSTTLRTNDFNRVK